MYRVCVSLAVCLTALAGCRTGGAPVSVAPSEHKVVKTETYKGSQRDRECLMRAMYFESIRSSKEGLLAVGSVVMNRVESEDFPNTVCEYATDEPVTSAELAGQRFPLRPQRADRILLVGDTGCRLKDGRPIQACNDPVAWPFAAIARSIAGKPADLAIHLGDSGSRK